ncbi:extracellular solute-binding protein [Propionibacteriaceae bacterium Y2011]
MAGGVHSSISRRTLLGGTLGALGVAGLAACTTGGGEGEPGGGSNEGGKLEPPTFTAFSDVEPDKPGNAEGVPPVFYNYPAEPVNREGFPLPGGEPWTALMQALPPKVPAEENKSYQEYEKAVGSKFQVIYGTSAQYTEKFQVTMASNDIPDFVQIVTVAQLPKLLESTFTDLTDILGGDGVSKYPGLANIPTATWKIPELNGRLWGIPQPRPPAGRVLTTRGDVMAERGIDDPYVKLRDGADFVDLLKQLTNKDKGEFSMGADPTSWLLTGVYSMMGGPNNWAVEDGKFVSQLTTEQYTKALVEAGKIVQAGYLHPNSFSDPGSNSAWYRAGTTALYFQSFVGWGGNARSNPEWNVGNIELPKWDGGGLTPIHKSVAGYGAYIAIKKSDDARLEQLLRVADYEASPFGTQQYLDVNYGVKGFSYNLEGPNPKSVPSDTSPGIVPMTYTGGNSGAILFGQGQTESVDAQYDFLSRAIPDGVEDASQGLYSETQVTKGATFAKQQKDVIREVLLGSKPITAWEEYVADWRKKVGDQIAGEYEEAAAR